MGTGRTADRGRVHWWSAALIGQNAATPTGQAGRIFLAEAVPAPPTSVEIDSIMSFKSASTDHPIHELLAERWSPYAFADRAVADADLCSLFEAARWAASSANEQPWRFVVAKQEHSEEFARLLSCLVDANQVWAQHAPVLMLGVVSQRFSRNDQENRSAAHDLGLAVGNLLVEATVRGLSVHQMAGILPDTARTVYQIPEGVEAWTAIAIGYAGDAAPLPDKLRDRELRPRTRHPLREFVFGGGWGEPSPILPG